MGVDADEMIRATEVEEKELWNYSHRYPAFKGEHEFDLTIAFLGKSVTRKAKIVYSHTPEWEYYDPQKKAPFTGWPGSSYRIEMTAVPEEWHDDDDNPVEGSSYWMRMKEITHIDLMPNEMWDALLDTVDEKCKVEDAERRRLAAAKPRPSSKRRH